MKCKCGHDESEHEVLADGHKGCMVIVNNSFLPFCDCEDFESVDELKSLRAQLAEAREIISEAKIEIGFAIHADQKPAISVHQRMAAYLKKYPPHGG